MERDSKASRSVAVALLMGLIALPAAAELPGTGDAAGGAVAYQLGGLQVDERHEAGAGPEEAYRWDKIGYVKPSGVLLPDELTSPRQTMIRIAQAALLLGLVGLGLTITFTSLFRDMKRRRRVIYRTRGPRSTYGNAERT
jgi:hypothetical protein